MISEKNLEVFGYECISAYSNKITDFGAFSQTNMITFKDKGVLFLRNQDIREGCIDENNSVFIDESIYNKLTLHLEEGDILIPRVGTLGNAALIKKNMLPCTSNQNLAIIRLKNEINKYAIIAILVSKIGNYQINRLSTGNVQQWLNLETIGNIKIPCLANDFMDKVGNLMEMSNISIIKSNEKYLEAENLLLSELGLENFNPSNEKISIKTLKESFLKTGRLDSEYYQLKYDEYLKKIKLNKHTTISNEFDLIKEKIKIGLDSYNYVEIGDVNVSDGKSNPKLIDEKDLPANAKIMPKKGDLLVSKVRPNRGAISIIEEDYSNLVVSGAFAVLREKKESDYRVETLKTLLRTPIYADWLLKFNVGTSYPVITDEDILSLPIPIIKSNIQDEIADYIKQSMEYSKKAKELLEISTKSVEIAIDKDEQAAHNFLEQNRTVSNCLL